MNDSTLTRLKVLVERAVRPVRASDLRKSKMREELLAHVTAVFAEESAASSDEETALQKTAGRFGDPSELTAQLQAAVPRLDGVKSFADRLWFRHGEHWLGRAIRQAIIMEILIVLLLLLPWLLNGAPTGSQIDVMLIRLGQYLPAFFLVAVSFTLLSEWMRRAMYGPRGRSYGQVAMVVAASAIAAFAFVLCVFFLEPRLGLDDNRKMLLLTLFMGLWTAFALAVHAVPVAERMRRHQEWAALPI